jgi:hypothetical protein
MMKIQIHSQIYTVRYDIHHRAPSSLLVFSLSDATTTTTTTTTALLSSSNQSNKQATKERMPVHSLHIFDRKGKTLFTKRFAKDDPAAPPVDTELLAEQRKLVFGMLFSLREVAAILSPETSRDKSGLQLMRTGAATLHTYESASGHRLALYVTNHTNNSNNNGGTSKSTVDAPVSQQEAASIREALHYIYHDLWIQCVVRSPLYRPTAPNVEATNFGGKLQVYLASQPWYKG